MFLILIFMVASALAVALYSFNDSVRQSISNQQIRNQEKISIVALTNVSSYITGIEINNPGSTTCRIRGVYVNSMLLSDPSEDKVRNPNDVYISAKESLLVNIPQILYDPLSTITAATERGVTTVVLEKDLVPESLDVVIRSSRPVYGPLEIDFDQFYCANSSSNGNYNPTSWVPGWRVNQTRSTGEYFVWNITVKNVDSFGRNITLNQYSALTLVPTPDVSKQGQWYIEPSGQPSGPNSPKTLLIQHNQTVSLVYIYNRPLGSNPISAQKVPDAQAGPMICKVFLAFFGRFEKNGVVSSYGQTIPFEAVLVVKSS